MNRVFRALAAVGLALAGAVVTTQSAVADEPDCTVDGQDYVPGGPCEMELTVTPTCARQVPLLTYAVVVEGSSARTTDIIWHNVGGADVVLTDQPLSGSALWPGTVLDGDGRATDWPGWTWDGSEWVTGDADDWAAGSLQVTFSVSPSATATVTYPMGCGPTTTSGGGGTNVGSGPEVAELSQTGTTAAPLVGGALGLLGLGALLVALARRRGRPAQADRL